MTWRRFVGVLLGAVLLAGCTAGEPTADTTPGTGTETRPGPTATGRVAVPPRSTPATPPVSPGEGQTRTRQPGEGWVLGAQVLPRRADGYGVMPRTPHALRVRRLPTEDLLPPPADGRYHVSVRPVTDRLVRRSDLAWSPSCPVPLRNLRYLRLSFWGFDGRPHTGEMVVNASVAADVSRVFEALYRDRFPIEEMRLVTRADLDAPPTGDGNNTAAYACRPAVGSTSWSAHAYGLAVDVNPFQNPYSRGSCPPRYPRDLDCVVLPELASAYLDRDWRRPGMIHPDGVVVRAFRDVGWTWGGDFRSVSDLHHFSATGR